MKRYSGSRLRMLRAIYPEVEWDPARFNKLPSHLGSDPETVEMVLRQIELKANLKALSDWYKLSADKLREIGYFQFMRKMGGLYKVLKRYRPEGLWDENKFIGVRHHGGFSLKACLSKLFPNLELIEDFPLDQAKVSYYLPALKLALDYQSPMSYGLFGASGKARVRFLEDAEKVAAAKKLGKTLLFVPFWWDRSPASLVATLLDKYPDLKDPIPNLEELSDLSTVTPIPLETSVDLSPWKTTQPSPDQPLLPGLEGHVELLGPSTRRKRKTPILKTQENSDFSLSQVGTLKAQAKSKSNPRTSKGRSKKSTLEQ